MKFQNAVLLSFHLLALSSAHFTLWTPIAIGANVQGGPMEGTGPCGSFDITNRDTITNWPVGGYPVYMITTHPQVVLEFRAALVNDTNTWINLIPPINQYGIGYFCEPSMPGFAPWVGLPVVLQVAQYAPDGINYQCAAITFVPGRPAPIGDCRNSSIASAAVAVGFTSTPPYGSVITPTNTALPSGSAAGTNGTITGGGNTATRTSSSTTASGTAASTSKAVSGAVAGFEGQGNTGLWIFLATLLGFGAWAL